MGTRVSQQMRNELIEAIRLRYTNATKEEKHRILDEFVAVSGYHRKHAIRLLSGIKELSSRATVPSRRVYDEAVREALIVLWEASDRICGKRLKAGLAQLVEAMERHQHLNLDPVVRQRLLSISAATIDRLLSPIRGEAGSRRRKRRVTKPSRQIPIRTFSDWNSPAPGFLEIDFVVQCGSSAAGKYLSSLVATDVCSGWVEAVPLLAREQSLVVAGLEVIGRQLPMPVKGIDSDNDSAFINDTLLEYCQRRKIEFTRCRAYRKNDQAWIEQKNGAVVRRFVGHERLSGAVAGQILSRLFQSMRLYVNYFQPSFKLQDKRRNGSKVQKVYFDPATPCDRLLERPDVDDEVKQTLRTEREQLDPLALLQSIREAQSALAAIASGDAVKETDNASLEQFLAGLPHLWESGEVRPTHRRREDQPRYWRTRKDPFAGVWSEILLWLQDEPDASAKLLFERLREKHPEHDFPPGQLRTLQRRIRQWRKVLARELVFGSLAEPQATEPSAVVVDPTSGPSV